jgi:GGDEF domain-containing protein
MTSRLDARGARKAVSRLIATWMIVGGLAPALIVYGATGPEHWPHRLAAVGITVCSGLLGLFWVRGRWPSKRQSASCAILGTGLAALTCVLLPDPLLGLMGAAVFTAVATYAAVFHSWRLIGAVLAVAATVIVVTGIRLAETSPAVALGLSITTTLIIVFVTFVERALIGLVDVDLFTGAIEPITGLLSREGFMDGLAVTIAARGRTDDRYLVMVRVSLDSFAAVADMAGAGRARELRVLVAQMLRDKARRDVVIGHLPDSDFLVADVFNTPDPDPLCQRISSGLSASAPELTASIGAVVTPMAPLTAMPPDELTETLLAVADKAVTDARSRGGNTLRVVYLPELEPSDGKPFSPD